MILLIINSNIIKLLLRGGWLSCQCNILEMSWAGGEVVVGKAGCLHEGVYYRRTDVPETSLHHIFAYAFRF